MFLTCSVFYPSGVEYRRIVGSLVCSWVKVCSRCIGVFNSEKFMSLIILCYLKDCLWPKETRDKVLLIAFEISDLQYLLGLEIGVGVWFGLCDVP